MIHKLREYMKTAPAALALTAMLIIAAVSMPLTLAYFSDYARAEGSKDIQLAWQTELKESVKNNDKHITIDNKGETPVIVRVQVFANADLLESIGPTTEGKWAEGSDGWWYYMSILKAGQAMPESDELFVNVKGAESLADKDFNIVVIHESQRAVYENNTTLKAPAGWDTTAVSRISVQ